MKNVLLLVVISFYSVIYGQNNSISFTKLGEFEYSWTYSAYTALFDDASRPYIYTASMELGLVTFDISDPTSPFPTDTILS